MGRGTAGDAWRIHSQGRNKRHEKNSKQKNTRGRDALGAHAGSWTEAAVTVATTLHGSENRESRLPRDERGGQSLGAGRILWFIPSAMGAVHAS